MYNLHSKLDYPIRDEERDKNVCDVTHGYLKGGSYI